MLVTVGTVGVAGWGGLGLGLADSGTAGTNRKCVNDDDTEHAHEHLAKASENAQTSFPWFQAKVSTVMTAVEDPLLLTRELNRNVTVGQIHGWVAVSKASLKPSPALLP